MEEQTKTKTKKSRGRKILKRTLIALGSIIAILVLLVAFSPLILETYINSESGNKTVNEIASDYLNAKVDFKKINIKVWKNMPNIELELVNSEIISKAIKDDLTDTLVKFDTLRLSVNVMEFLNNDSIIINEAYLSNPTVNGYVTADGKANWEIYESDTTPDEDTSAFEYKIRIKQLLIDDLKATYIDDESQMKASLDSTNLELTGEITAEIIDIATSLKLKASYDDGSSQIAAKAQPSTINLNGNISKGDYNLTTKFGLLSAEFSDSSSKTIINLDTIGIDAHAIISDTAYDLDSKLNLVLSEYNDSALTFSNIPLDIELKGKTNTDINAFDIDTLNITSSAIYVGASGKAKNLADSSWNTDLSLNLDIPQIDNVLEMIPQSLVPDLKKYRISGSVNFNGTVKGTYKDEIYPDIDANLVLNDIRAIVLEQNAQVKLDMETDLKYISEKQNESYINIKRLNASVGETFLDLKGKASNILGDPYVNAKLKCNLNLDYISSLFPIDDLTYKGQLSSDIEARFSLNNLMKVNIPKIYMLGNINIERILLRIPSMKFFVFGKNATADIGLNSTKSRRTQKIQLSSARVNVDTIRIMSPHTIEARVSRLNLYANIEEPINDVPHLLVSGRLKGMEAIVADTMFVSGKTGRISLAIRPDTTDALIPALRASLGLDSITYYEPTMGAFLDSTRIVLNGKPRVRRFRRVNGERVAIDQSTRTSINADSLISLCSSIEDADGALRKFKFDGKIFAKTARMMSPYFDLKTGTRRLDITFTDDTLHLNNFMLRIGRSFMKVNGRVDNLRRAYLRGRTLSADLSVSALNLDINEMLYANYIGAQQKKKDDDAKRLAQNDSTLLLMQNFRSQIPKNISDSARRVFLDSIRRSYNSKDLSQIYGERMGKMKEMIEQAQKEESSNISNIEAIDTTEADYDTVPMTLFEIPSNLNCKINLQLDTVKFAGLKMQDLNGDLTAQNSTLSIKDLKTTSNVGDLKLNAIYKCNTLDSARAGIDLIGTNITVEDLLSAVPMIDSILPMLSSFEGKLDCELSAITSLDKEMEPILPSLQTACHIKGKNLVLLDGETFTTIAKYLLFKKKTENVIDNMSVEFTIDKNMLSVYPFTISMDKYKVAVSGKMDFDFKYFFHISVLEPKALPIPLGINVQTKEPKKDKKNKNKDEESEEDGELLEEDDDFQYRLVKPLYKDEKSIAQSINLVNKSGFGRISLQQSLRNTIQNIIENYDEKKKDE